MHNLIDAKYQQMTFRSVPTTHLLEIWSNKSDANLEDSDCTVQMLLFVSISPLMRDPKSYSYTEFNVYYMALARSSAT